MLCHLLRKLTYEGDEGEEDVENDEESDKVGGFFGVTPFPHRPMLLRLSPADILPAAVTEINDGKSGVWVLRGRCGQKMSPTVPTDVRA